MTITSLTAAWYPTIIFNFYGLNVTAVSILLCFVQCLQRPDCGGFLWTVSNHSDN